MVYRRYIIYGWFINQVLMEYDGNGARHDWKYDGYMMGIRKRVLQIHLVIWKYDL